MNYYNEFDKYPAQWMRNLAEYGHIPKGTVDERSICDVAPKDLYGFIQCHFFAGIAGWPLALRLAGWPEDRPVWTGSCPCQPFSNAGKGKGVDDSRHLWPAFRWLIAQRRPPVVFGEQVASKAGREWLAGVRADLEALGYEVGAADLCAASVGAPHIRQRLFWVAYAESAERKQPGRTRAGRERFTNDGSRVGFTNSPRSRSGKQTASIARYGSSVEPAGGDCVVGYAINKGLQGHTGDGNGRYEPRREPAEQDGSASQASGDSGLADAKRRAAERYGYKMGGTTREVQREVGKQRVWNNIRDGESTDWSDFYLIPCADGKQRSVKSGICPLAHGVPARVGALKAYGNAIVPAIAAEFVKAFMEI